MLGEVSHERSSKPLPLPFEKGEGMLEAGAVRWVALKPAPLLWERGGDAGRGIPFGTKSRLIIYNYQLRDAKFKKIPTKSAQILAKHKKTS